MGRSGMSGGGRSSGGGGGRSSGGRSSSSSRSGSTFSSHSSSRSGSYSGPFGGGHSHHHHNHYGYGPVYRDRRVYRTNSLVSTLVAVVIILVIIVALINVFSLSSGSGVTSSTIAREPLPKSASIETQYFTDELRWIDSSAKLKTGMKNFYDATGVQPHLYITDNLDGKAKPTNGEIDAWMSRKYDELFRDEAHMLVLFLENSGEYISWYMCGSQAKTVIDQEAADIVLDYIDRYYYSNMKDDEMFSKAFDDAGKRIMTVTKSPWIPVFMVAGVIVTLIILFNIWKAKKRQKNLEAEQTEKILNAPLESIGSTQDPLNNKYDNI